MSEQPELQFATDSSARVAEVRKGLLPLLVSSTSTPSGTEQDRWCLTADRLGIERTLKFRTFRQASQYMTLLFRAIAEHRHHPRLVNEYNQVSLQWSTHKDRESGMAGISELDVKMAIISDEIAKELIESSS